MERKGSAEKGGGGGGKDGEKDRQDAGRRRSK